MRLETSKQTPVGLIGLGIMGSAYAENLLKRGFVVVGYDVSAPARDRLEAAGGRALGTVAQVAAASDRILLALPSPAALAEVAREIAPKLGEGAIVCEMGTFAIADKEAARAELAASRALLLDCPVSGTGSQAAAGDLVIFASGAESACADMAPVFAAISRKVVHAGPFGAGMKLKCVANLLVSVHNLATAEAMLLAQRAGLDLAMTFEAIREGAGNSRVWELRGPLMAAGRYEPASMKLDVHLKDLAIIKAFADLVGAPTPLLEASAPFYHAAVAEGRGREDTAALYETLKESGAARANG
jgi:3-hydroxyisobutyrate dehydrogenase-like beta-hydroxyacid dehydrogenase